MRDDELQTAAVPGVVTGLAWTALGGATLEIEAIAIPADKGGFQLSGQLGDVMKESAALARSWLRAHATELGVADGWFDQHLIRRPCPAGATPKRDGPSAGITMATAMLSLALDKAVKRGLGMTGELTLTGRVYPIGGVREKIIAARRNGLKMAIFPEANRRDVAELPDRLKKGIEIVFVSAVTDVLGLPAFNLILSLPMRCGMTRATSLLALEGCGARQRTSRRKDGNADTAQTDQSA